MASEANGVNTLVGQRAPGRVMVVNDSDIDTIRARHLVRSPNKTGNLVEVPRVMDHGACGVRALSPVVKVFKPDGVKEYAVTETN